MSSINSINTLHTNNDCHSISSADAYCEEMQEIFFPPELMCRIFSFLGDEHLRKCIFVNRTWKTHVLGSARYKAADPVRFISEKLILNEIQIQIIQSLYNDINSSDNLSQINNLENTINESLIKNVLNEISIKEHFDLKNICEESNSKIGVLLEKSSSRHFFKKSINNKNLFKRICLNQAIVGYIDDVIKYLNDYRGDNKNRIYFKILNTQRYQNKFEKIPEILNRFDDETSRGLEKQLALYQQQYLNINLENYHEMIPSLYLGPILEDNDKLIANLEALMCKGHEDQVYQLMLSAKTSSDFYEALLVVLHVLIGTNQLDKAIKLVEKNNKKLEEFLRFSILYKDMFTEVFQDLMCCLTLQGKTETAIKFLKETLDLEIWHKVNPDFIDIIEHYYENSSQAEELKKLIKDHFAEMIWAFDIRRIAENF